MDSVENNVILSVDIPALPPSVNQAVRYGKGRFYDNKEKVDFKKIAIPIIKRAYGDHLCYVGKCALLIELSDSTARRWDIDNRVKVVQDCLGMAHGGAGVIKDDTCIWDLHVRRFKCSADDGKKTRLILTVYDDGTKKS